MVRWLNPSRLAANATEMRHGDEMLNKFNVRGQLPNLRVSGSNPLGVTNNNKRLVVALTTLTEMVSASCP